MHEYFILIGLDYRFMLAKILVIAVGLSVNVVFRLTCLRLYSSPRHGGRRQEVIAPVHPYSNLSRLGSLNRA